jgi:hypothetical protein
MSLSLTGDLRQGAQADSRPAAPGKCSAARGKLKILSLSTAFETADVDGSVWDQNSMFRCKLDALLRSTTRLI